MANHDGTEGKAKVPVPGAETLPSGEAVVKKGTTEKDDAALDEALKESFPASDPPEMTEPKA